MGWLTEDDLNVPVSNFSVSNDGRLIAATC
jgi:hypothetical protein